MNYRLVPVLNISVDFVGDWLFDADNDQIYRAINDQGKSAREYFLIERIPEVEAIYEHEFR